MIGSTAAAQTERILHSFTGGSDGLFPESGMIFDGKGNLYGTTAGGGANGGCSGCGTVFKLSPTASGAWTETILYGFGASFGDGIDSLSSLTFDGKGNLYGTTITGGGQQEGTVFELSPSLGGTWTEKILINFTGGTDGGQPVGGLVFDSVGNLYGVTSVGGLHGFGTVFRLTPGAGGTWTEQVLHSFAGGNDGATPTFGNTLIPDGAGNLYGVASQGGLHDYGVVFELVRASGWAEKVLYAFPGGSGGSFPEGSLVFDHAGNLYGSASYTVFELSPTSSGFWTEKTLHSFVGGSDGASAAAGLIFDKAGNLYGTTGTGGAHRGIVFELTPTTAGTWTEKILHRFSATGGDGTFPGFGTLTIDSTGHLYGTTTSGGSSNDGVVFQVTP
ncbi:MAG TPA: choice-of-anchor tandem repeat GloVer-containing protein [Candidatus Sulfotelmatobacter sp.]|nr:choice-of-anchor tandem repeat GloVer-containing protein [Candidatus Sulfotelmatobacter sp.]